MLSPSRVGLKSWRSLLPLFTLLIALDSFAQYNTPGDSLIQAYQSGNYFPSDELSLLDRIVQSNNNPEERLSYSNRIVDRARALDSTRYLYIGYLHIGNAYRLKSDLTKALENYYEAAHIASNHHFERELGIVNITIADVYSIMGNHRNAVIYYDSAIYLLRLLNDSLSLSSALLNAGDEYLNQDSLNKAMAYFQESGKIFTALEYSLGLAYNLGNIGMVLAKQGKHDQALSNINKAISILEKEKDFYPISVYLTYVSEIYSQNNQLERALGYAHKSLQLAEQYGLKKQIADANLLLSGLYEKKGKKEEALSFYKAYNVFQDSVNNITSVQKMADLRTEYEISQKQLEVDLLNQQKKTQQIITLSTIGALVLILILAALLYNRYRYTRKTNSLIEQERDRSEKLLLNILPSETAEELKSFGKVTAKRFESVSILFTDFVGFSKLSESESAEKLVQSVDFYYSNFDAIIKKYGLEKIKTIGDSYMCAGGLPQATADHAEKIICAAIDIISFVQQNNLSDKPDCIPFDVRLGVHSGPVIAGVVGTTKFAYDIWGESVNIASRMETSSLPGAINISESTYKLVKQKFVCEYRGEIQAKNLGPLKMYFVTRLKTSRQDAGSI